MSTGRDSYLDALLDSVDARRDLAERYSRDLAEDLADELGRIVSAAARPGATEARNTSPNTDVSSAPASVDE